MKHNFAAEVTPDVPQFTRIPTVMVPASSGQVKPLQVGQTVRIVLEGKIQGVRDDDWSSSIDLELATSEVTVTQEATDGKQEVEGKASDEKANVFAALAEGN